MHKYICMGKGKNILEFVKSISDWCYYREQKLLLNEKLFGAISIQAQPFTNETKNKTVM